MSCLSHRRRPIYDIRFHLEQISKAPHEAKNPVHKKMCQSILFNVVANQHAMMPKIDRELITIA